MTSGTVPPCAELGTAVSYAKFCERKIVGVKMTDRWNLGLFPANADLNILEWHIGDRNVVIDVRLMSCSDLVMFRYQYLEQCVRDKLLIEYQLWVSNNSSLDNNAVRKIIKWKLTQIITSDEKYNHLYNQLCELTFLVVIGRWFKNTTLQHACGILPLKIQPFIYFFTTYLFKILIKSKCHYLTVILLFIRINSRQ